MVFKDNAERKGSKNAIIKFLRIIEVDLQILELVCNGHGSLTDQRLGFDSQTHLVDRDLILTIEVNARFFDKIEDVPAQAVK